MIANIQSDHKVTHFIIIQSADDRKRLIDRVHSYQNVNTIYIYCDHSELKQQRRLSHNYAKLDAVFDDPCQVLIKLLMDLALFHEELGDRQNGQRSLIQLAHKNYQRSVDLYSCAEKIVG